jgi:hypothetical protein
MRWLQSGVLPAGPNLSIGCFQIRFWDIGQHKKTGGGGEEGKPVNHPRATAGDGYGTVGQQTDW